jgi:hypothetical protein
MEDRAGNEVDVGGVQAGDGVSQVHRDAVGEARGDSEYPPFPAGAGKAPAVECVDGVGPADVCDRGVVGGLGAV